MFILVLFLSLVLFNFRDRPCDGRWWKRRRWWPHPVRPEMPMLKVAEEKVGSPLFRCWQSAKLKSGLSRGGSKFGRNHQHLRRDSNNNSSSTKERRKMNSSRMHPVSHLWPFFSFPYFVLSYTLFFLMTYIFMFVPIGAHAKINKQTNGIYTNRRGGARSEEAHPADGQRHVRNTGCAFGVRPSAVRDDAQCSIFALVHVATSLLRRVRMLSRRLAVLCGVAHRDRLSTFLCKSTTIF